MVERRRKKKKGLHNSLKKSYQYYNMNRKMDNSLNLALLSQSLPSHLAISQSQNHLNIKLEAEKIGLRLTDLEISFTHKTDFLSGTHDKVDDE